jgi:hypothetical protein
VLGAGLPKTHLVHAGLLSCFLLSSLSSRESMFVSSVRISSRLMMSMMSRSLSVMRFVFLANFNKMLKHDDSQLGR